MKVPTVTDPDVQAVFDGYDPVARKTLQEIRQLIFTTADQTNGVGALVETLKWGQISYLPKKPRVGTTVRIDKPTQSVCCAALFFHCQTTLLETFRERYPDYFRYIGNRSIELDDDWRMHSNALQHCLAMALSYHLANAKE